MRENVVKVDTKEAADLRLRAESSYLNCKTMEETRSFYELFYRLELDDDELIAILETAGVDVSELR